MRSWGMSTCGSTCRSVTPGTSRDRRFHLLGLAAQHVEIVAVELDGNLRLHAREHVRNQVLQGLLDADHDAGDVGHAPRGSRRDFLARVRVASGSKRGDDLA